MGSGFASGFSEIIHSHWRGWNVVLFLLFLDKDSSHTARESPKLAKELGLDLKILPTATPELNAMDQLWRHVKGRALANRRTASADQSVNLAAGYLLHMSSYERLKKVGAFAKNFWLKNLTVK